MQYFLVCNCASIRSRLVRVLLAVMSINIKVFDLHCLIPAARNHDCNALNANGIARLLVCCHFVSTCVSRCFVSFRPINF